ncbi:uncharacterized protein SPAPADRAFT_142076 [Spathaspora passalidarum NRRL Y-27907]|uniref:SET domain-containing protein n=1 Tax=Spathaspora passalidarum (strain NRRL Y-27907 / 11-Y1) TaxID=619300 RepID=G3ASS6_SPAPN|nr:uncharacterized protein SPAPADRAFT_142076 [Spathaspora passalidarum NRRL Y-27907]EGW31140.1 hypothetical protein SPAPADRAFT_142076 [Spathaspora passalidarum NRRL Y-27907]
MIHLDTKLVSLLEWIHNTQDEKLKPSSYSYISPKLEVRDVKGSGRGIYTNGHLNKSELVIRIPPSFLLNTTTVLSHISKYNTIASLSTSNIYTPFETIHDEFTKIYESLTKEELLDLSSFQLLGMYITIETQRGKSSFWKPFLDMLPSIADFELMPLVWQINNQHDLLDLLPQPIRKTSEKVYTRFTSDYNTVTALLQTKIDNTEAVLPLDQFLLAWICINSRCLYMNLPTSKSASDNFTMAPYVDFLNHSPNDHCTLKIDGRGFQVFSTCAYSENEQVYLSYGPHSNDFLLCEYGFTISDNKWNDLDVTEYLRPLFTSEQKRFLKEHDYWGNYTVNKEGISFRTEVALAVLQENTPTESRKLMGLINGITDGVVFKLKSDILLKTILNKVIHEAEQYKHLEFNNETDLVTRERKKVIGGLYNDRVTIATNVLSNL